MSNNNKRTDATVAYELKKERFVKIVLLVLVLKCTNDDSVSADWSDKKF
jgi:hypothetical protein